MCAVTDRGRCQAAHQRAVGACSLVIDDVLGETPDAKKLAGVIGGEDIDQSLSALGRPCF